jgi:hypothetical protein
MTTWRAALIAAAGFAAGCATAPSRTAGQIALTRNPRAAVEGRLLDASGNPVASMRVYAIPLARDVLWSGPATTDADGRFELTLFAPASYTFLLCRYELCVMTSDMRDASRVGITVEPGRRCSGIELRFLSELWNDVLREE